MENEKFDVKVVGILFNTATRQVLLGKATGDENYSFVEGDLTYKEELDDCLKRITKEKTGYSIHNLGAIYAENMLKEEDKLKVHFLCETSEGEITPGENVEELIWVKPKEIEEKLGQQLPTRLHEYVNSLG